MGFRNEFFLEQRASARRFPDSLQPAGFKCEREELNVLSEALRDRYQTTAAKFEQAPEQPAEQPTGDLRYLAGMIEKDLAGTAAPREEADKGLTEGLVTSIQRACDLLGGEFVESRWMIERYSHVSADSFWILLNSLDEVLRSYFEGGIRCYEMRDYPRARELFTRLLTANRKHYFIYQYMGFISVAEEKPEATTRNFELAQRIAEHPYHRALAISHLARAQYAVGDGKNALELSTKAAEAFPAAARFWYEVARFCMPFRQDDEMVKALQAAIERESEYFAVVAIDEAFDPARSRVNALLSDLRKHEGEKAFAQVEELRKVLIIANSVEAGDEVGKCAAACAELAKKLERNIFFLHRQVQKEAREWVQATLETARKSVERRFAYNRASALRCEDDKQSRIQELHDSIARLRIERSRIEYEFKPSSMGCSLYAGLWVLFAAAAVWPFNAIAQHGELSTANALTVLVLAVAPFVLPLIALGTVNALNHHRRVTIPIGQIQSKIRAKEEILDSEIRRIREEFRADESTIESELLKLDRYKAMIGEY